MVCRPRDLGGLGIADLHRVGVVLRVQWPWLRRIDPERSWGFLPEREERMVAAVFQVATISVLGNSESTLFWLDN